VADACGEAGALENEVDGRGDALVSSLSRSMMLSGTVLRGWVHSRNLS
jgi:hypothetical protein